MKKFCIFLREHAADVIILEKKKMLLTEKEWTSNQDLTIFYICRKKFKQNLPKKELPEIYRPLIFYW